MCVCVCVRGVVCVMERVPVHVHWKESVIVINITCVRGSGCVSFSKENVFVCCMCVTLTNTTLVLTCHVCLRVNVYMCGHACVCVCMCVNVCTLPTCVHLCLHMCHFFNYIQCYHRSPEPHM